jgi:chaperonin cofactor prefoldin
MVAAEMGLSPLVTDATALHPRRRACHCTGSIVMDKKQKKKTDVLHQRIQHLRQRLAGARKQMDDPDELKSLEQQLAAAEAELAKIKP